MSPVTLHDVTSATEQTAGDSGAPAPSRTLTPYDVIREPPSDSGAFHDTVALPSAAIAVGFWGGCGFVSGVAVTSAEAGPSPWSLVAVTRKVIAWPPVRPAMEQEVPFVMHTNGWPVP